MISPKRYDIARHARGGGLRGDAANQRLDPREELDHLERLDQVVVGPQLQTDDLVHDLTAGGQHQDRRVNPALSQRAAHVEPVAAGQHDIEQDGVERARGCARETSHGIALAFDLVPFGHEAIGERHDEPGFVLDEEHTPRGHAAV